MRLQPVGPRSVYRAAENRVTPYPDEFVDEETATRRGHLCLLEGVCRVRVFAAPLSGAYEVERADLAARRHASAANTDDRSNSRMSAPRLEPARSLRPRGDLRIESDEHPARTRTALRVQTGAHVR